MLSVDYQGAIMKQNYIDLPKTGLSRFDAFAHFLPFSREKFRRMGLQKRAPVPIRLGSRITFYKNEELHKFFDDPLNYRADVE